MLIANTSIGVEEMRSLKLYIVHIFHVIAEIMIAAYLETDSLVRQCSGN